MSTGLNDILHRNSKLLTARYPSQKLRLGSLLDPARPSKELERREASLEEATVKTAQKYPKVLLICGGLDMNLVSHILNQKELSQIRSIYFIENNEEVIAKQFREHDWTQFLINPNMHFFFGLSKEEAYVEFFQSLENPRIASIAKSVLVYYNPALVDSEKEFYTGILNAYSDAREHRIKTFGSFDDYMEGVRATVANTRLVREAAGIWDLKGKYPDRPALLVGTGPHLNEALPILKKNQDKFLIIAADSAIAPLMKAGVRSDYTVSIERWNGLQAKFWNGLEASSPLLPELVAFPVVHEESFKLFPGKIRITYRNYAYYFGLEKSNPKGILHSFGSCLHLGLRLARWMGCPKVYMIGVDLSLQKVGEDSYVSHSKNTAYSGEWDRGKSKDELTQDWPKHAPFWETTSYAGETILTNRIYNNWASEFSTESLQPKWRGWIEQCTPTSPVMEGIPYRPFSELCAELPVLAESRRAAYPVKPKTTPVAPPYPQWIKHLKGYARVCGDLFQYLRQRGEDASVEDLQVIVFYINNLLPKEIFFSNWVLQCSTGEIIHLQNELLALSDNPEDDVGDERVRRRAWLLEILKLYSNHAAKIAETVNTGWEKYLNE